MSHEWDGSRISFETFSMMEGAWSKENKLHLIDLLLQDKGATLFGLIQRVAESPGGIERMRALLSGRPTDFCTD